MEKEPIYKHCRTATGGMVGLSQALVETALLINKCPIVVTCDAFPGETSVYTEKDLQKPMRSVGPFPNKYKEGETYILYLYQWKNSKIEEGSELSKMMTISPKTVSEIEIQEEEVLVEMEKSAKELEEPLEEIVTVSKTADDLYEIKTLVPVITYEEVVKTVTLNEYIGERIKEERLKKGLNQRQLAEKVNNGVNQSTVSVIEAGHSKIAPNLNSIAMICKGLEIPIAKIFPEV